MWSEAEDLCRHGALACERLGRIYEKGRFLNQLGNILSYRGLRHEAMAAMEEAHGILSRNPDDGIMVSVLYNLGYACEHFGDLDKSLEHYASGQDLARRLGDHRSENRANGNIGIIYAMRGDFGTALDYFRRLLELSAKLEDPAGVALAHGNLGLALLYSGKPEEAEAHLQLKLKLSREMGDRLGICQALGSLGDLQASRGDYPSALKSYQQAREHAVAMNNLNMTVTADEKTGEVMVLQGRYPEAAGVFIGAIDLVEKRGSRLSLPSLWQKAGDCYLETGQLDLAEKAFNKSITAGKEDSQEPFYMGAYRGLARLENLRGQSQRAMEYCRRFLELSEKYNDRNYIFEGRVLECLIKKVTDPEAAIAGLSELLTRAGSDANKAEVLYWRWEIRRTARDRQEALEALKLAAAQTPSALYETRLNRLQE
jgi:tetratricopeptide (TPR) repeat protein